MMQKPMMVFFIYSMISVLFLSNGILSDKIDLKFYQPDNTEQAKDVGSLGDLTAICGKDGSVSKLFKENPQDILLIGGDVPKCSSIEVDTDENFWVIDEKKNLYKIELTSLNGYLLHDYKTCALDVGASHSGEVFIITCDKKLKRKVDEEFKTVADNFPGLRLDVGMTNTGKVAVFYTNKWGQVMQASLDKSNKKIEKTIILTINADDLTVGSDNQLYVSSQRFGSFVRRPGEHHFDNIASFGVRIAAGNDLYLLTKKEGHVLVSGLVPKKKK